MLLNNTIVMYNMFVINMHNDMSRHGKPENDRNLKGPHGIDSSSTNRVRSALEHLGFECEQIEMHYGDMQVDIVATRDGKQFAVEIAALDPARHRHLVAQLAGDILRLMRLQREHGLEPLMAIVSRKARPQLDRFRDYVDKHAPGMSWLAVDPSGAAHWFLDGKHGANTSLVKAWVIPESSSSPPRRDPFAPQFQWLLKILMLAGMKKRYWGGPQIRPKSVTELARLAGVSQPYGSMFGKVMESRGYLRRKRGELVVPDVRRVLEDWSNALQIRRGKEVSARPLYGNLFDGGEIEDLMARLRSSGARYAVGSHYAAFLHGLSRSNVRQLRLYVDIPLSRALASLDLVSANDGETPLILARPPSSPLVFDAVVEVDQVRVVDVLQCYLDVRGSSSRGVEQAEHIFERVLAPHFQELGWH